MRRETQATAHIAAPPADVFAIVSDHEATDQWVPKVEAVQLLEPGTPKNGVPALRRVTFKPFGTVTWAVWFEFNPWIWALGAGIFLQTFTQAMVEGLATLANQQLQGA